MIETISREVDRITVAQKLLLKFRLDTDDPRWSSATLDGLVETVMTTAGGTVADLLNAVWGVLEDYRPQLSQSVANFFRDLVVKCYTTERRSYEAMNWSTFIQKIHAGSTKSQLYLAMLAVPDQFMNEDLKCTIVSGLKPTPFGEEAASLLAA